MSCPEAAKKWGISDRRVQKLCEENRIKDVSRIGNMWLIPQNAKKPDDKRKKRRKKIESAKPDISVGDTVCGKPYNDLVPGNIPYDFQEG